MNTTAILAAAGMGRRLGEGRPKMWAQVSGEPLIRHALKCLDAVTWLKAVLVMVPPSEADALKKLLPRWGLSVRADILAGGERRQDTVRIALEALGNDSELALIHDAARPLASPELFGRVRDAASRSGAAAPVIPPVDSIIKLDGPNPKYLDRANIRCAQTPQAFRTDLIREAHSKARETGFLGDDDASLVASMGGQVSFVEGEPGNFKVTRRSDLLRLEAALKIRP